MTTVIQGKRQAATYLVPAGGEILWYGIAANVPSGWAIDSYCANVFLRGVAAGGASNTPASDNSHTHTNPAATGSQAAHTHPIGGGNTGAASGSREVYQTNNVGSAPDGHTHTIGSGTSGSGGGHSHAPSAAAIAAAYPPYARLYWIKAISDVIVPVGGILMWDNVIASKPTGFSLCNGSGGTIDLRDKFVYGASADGELGATGGADTHVHANSATGAAGAHTHSLGVSTGNSASNNNVSGYSGGTTVADGGHNHSISATSDSDADHTHSMSDTGAGSSLPPYLKLYFIQRTS